MLLPCRGSNQTCTCVFLSLPRQQGRPNPATHPPVFPGSAGEAMAPLCTGLVMEPVLLGPPLRLGRSARVAAVGEVGSEDDSRAEAAAAAAAASAWSRCRTTETTTTGQGHNPKTTTGPRSVHIRPEVHDTQYHRLHGAWRQRCAVQLGGGREGWKSPSRSPTCSSCWTSSARSACSFCTASDSGSMRLRSSS